jgi:hypothetical protein
MLQEDTKPTAATSQKATKAEEPAAVAAAAPSDDGTAAADDDAESECPICKFMQAGPCGEGHKVSRACAAACQPDQHAITQVQLCSHNNTAAQVECGQKDTL